MKEKDHEDTSIRNRKAHFEYTLFDRYEAGIVLKGSEVKSIRNGQVSLQDAYVRVQQGEAFIINLYIAPYEFARLGELDTRATRKLLLKKSELMKLTGELSTKGYTLIPLKLYFKRGRVKLEIALAKGKRQFDKRDSIKKNEQRREIDRAMKYKG